MISGKLRVPRHTKRILRRHQNIDIGTQNRFSSCTCCLSQVNPARSRLCVWRFSLSTQFPPEFGITEVAGSTAWYTTRPSRRATLCLENGCQVFANGVVPDS